MKKLFYVFFAFLIGTVSILAGCTKKTDDTTIRLGEVTRSIFYAPLYIAIENKYFEEENIKVKLLTGEGANVSMTSLIAGQVDIGLMGVEAAIYVNAEGSQNAPKVFGQLTKRDGSFLVGREPIDNFDWFTHLQNKEILAGRKGGMPFMTLEYALNKIGLYDGVNVTLNTSVPYGNMGPAFAGGAGDFTTLFEPNASSLVRNNNSVILGSVGELAGAVPFTAFMANQSYLNKNTAKIEAFLRAIKKGYDYLMTETLDNIAKALKPMFETFDDEDIKASIESYKNIDAWMEDMAMSQDDYDRLIAILINAGELKTDHNIKITDIVDNKYANAIKG